MSSIPFDAVNSDKSCSESNFKFVTLSVVKVALVAFTSAHFFVDIPIFPSLVALGTKLRVVILF